MKSMEYEIHIGEVFDMDTNSKKPKQILIITQEQKEVIDIFSNQKKDSELNIIYTINECEFIIMPHISAKRDKV